MSVRLLSDSTDHRPPFDLCNLAGPLDCCAEQGLALHQLASATCSATCTCAPPSSKACTIRCYNDSSFSALQVLYRMRRL